jgi:tRNA1Val (adenine37-N6)-methyltransferase
LKHDGETTRDALFGGALTLHQPARKTGYRVNVDALLLADFARGGPRRAKHAVDLGSGVGAVGLSLLHLGVAQRVTMVEIDAALAALARQNAEENGWSARIAVRHADVLDTRRELHGSADLVVCNPPYVPPGRGRPPRGAVRGAKYGELVHFIDAARAVAGRRARVAFVYPAIELTSLFLALRSRSLEPKRLRAVHGRVEDVARVVLVEAVAGKAGGLAVEPPFIETQGGKQSAELAALLSHPRVEQ